MDDFESIESAIADVTKHEAEIKTENGGAEQITVMSTDPVEILRTQVFGLVSENAEIKKRLSDLEGKIIPLLSSIATSRNRTEMAIPKTDVFAKTSPASNVSRGRSRNESINTSSMVDVRRPGSTTPSTTASAIESINPFVIQTQTRGTDLSTQKKLNNSNAAVAEFGYTNSKQVWGTGLAVMLIAATRFYIERSGMAVIRAEEKYVVANCIKVVSTFYSQAVHRNLPDVKDHTTLALAKMLAKSDKNDIPVSSAEGWWKAAENVDGKDILRIFDTIISLMKMVPESLAHPVSQIVPFLVPPVVRTVVKDGNTVPIFAMSAGTTVNVLPNEWERWCSILREEALTKYIKYRLSGMKEPQVVSKMVSEMKSSELTDKKNAQAMGELTPFTIKHPSHRAS